MACSLVFHVLELYTYHRRDEETHARIGDTEDKIYDADDAVTVVVDEAVLEGNPIREEGTGTSINSEWFSVGARRRRSPPHTRPVAGTVAGGGGNHRSD